MIRDPAARERISELIDEIFNSDALAEDAVAVLRVPRGETLSPEPSAAQITDDRNYGHSRVIFYAHKRKPREGAEEPAEEEPTEEDV